jgi:hypothetical protein
MRGGTLVSHEFRAASFRLRSSDEPLSLRWDYTLNASFLTVLIARAVLHFDPYIQRSAAIIVHKL